MATSNAQLVARIVRIAQELGRDAASPDKAREMLGLRLNTQGGVNVKSKGAKLCQSLSPKAALSRINDGSSVMIGGFMTCGTPVNLVRKLVKLGIRDLTIIVNDTGGVQGDGIGMLISADAVKHLIASHIGTNPETGQKRLRARSALNWYPKGR